MKLWRRYSWWQKREVPNPNCWWVPSLEYKSFIRLWSFNSMILLLFRMKFTEYGLGIGMRGGREVGGNSILTLTVKYHCMIVCRNGHISNWWIAGILHSDWWREQEPCTLISVEEVPDFWFVEIRNPGLWLVDSRNPALWLVKRRILLSDWPIGSRAVCDQLSISFFFTANF